MSKYSFLLLSVMLCWSLLLASCNASRPRGSMIPANLAIERIELVSSAQETVVADPASIASLARIFERSNTIEQSSNQIKFSGDVKKLRVIASEPEKSRIYRFDTTNGYATIASKAVMPVYKIEQIDAVNELLHGENQ